MIEPMRNFLLALAVVFLGLGYATGATRGPTTLPLGVLDTGPVGPRVFTVPVQINGVDLPFTWNCAGSSHISETGAKKCNLRITDLQPGLQQFDRDHRPFYAGQAEADVKLGDQSHHVTMIVIRDEMCQESEKPGYVGFDLSKWFQWTLDPVTPALILAPPGTKPTTQPIAALPIRMDGLSVLLNVKVRNEPLDVRLLPASTYIQADPFLQHKWDLSSKEKLEVQSGRFGAMSYLELHGKDTVEMGHGLSDTDLVVFLVGNANAPANAPKLPGGIGAELLNRYVFTIDPKTKMMYVLSRVVATTQPAGDR